MSSSNNEPVKKLFAKPVWWALFLAATILMSLWFRTFKVFTLHPNFSTGSTWLLVMFILIVNIALLAYDSYLHEKAKGKIHKPIRLFEWLSDRHFLMFSHASSKDATL